MSEKKIESNEFVELFKNRAEKTDFWFGLHKKSILAMLESRFAREAIRGYGIKEIVPNGDEFLIHWYKRIIPLTDEQLKEIYD